MFPGVSLNCTLTSALRSFSAVYNNKDTEGEREGGREGRGGGGGGGGERARTSDQGKGENACHGNIETFLKQFLLAWCRNAII